MFYLDQIKTNQYKIMSKKKLTEINPSEDELIIPENDVFSEEEEMLFGEECSIIHDEDITEIENSENFDLIFKLNTNKHKQEGKHKLDRDTIFKGKLDVRKEGDDLTTPEDIFTADQDFDGETINIFDNIYDTNDTDYLKENNLVNDIHHILDTKTTINFSQNRRKPNKENFNEYYDILVKELYLKYSKLDIFVELSYYFTENIFNVFKLLDKKAAIVIIKELKKKGYLRNLDGINFL